MSNIPVPNISGSTPQNTNFIPPKFGPASGTSRQPDLLNVNEIFADYYFPPDVEQPPLMGPPYFDGLDSDFLNFLCAPEFSHQTSIQPNMGMQQLQPGGQFMQNVSQNMQTMMQGSHIRVAPLPRSTIPMNPNMFHTPQSHLPVSSVPLGTGHPLHPGTLPYNSRSDANAKDDDSGDESGKRRKKVGITDGREMTIQQKLERRERNREHAKRSRIRKKVLLDTLQDQLMALRNENTKLRRIVAEKIPERAQEILEKCTTEESQLLLSDSDNEDLDRNRADKLAEAVSMSASPAAGAMALAANKDKSNKRILVEPDFRLIGSLITSQQNFVVSDPSLPDNPIVYCSEGFCKLTGYKRSEVLGRNCRFLQGPETDQRAVDMIRQGIAEGRDVSVCLLNYKADGSTFWNQFFVAALRGADGQIVNYVGVQCEVNTLPVSQMKDRVKKLPLSFL